MSRPTSGTGLFLLTGLLLAVGLLMALAREKHWGQPRFPVLLRTFNADGLRPGMEVRLSGMPVGRVEQLSLQPDASVLVRLAVEQQHRRLIGPGSRAFQGQEGLVGDHYIGIDPRPLAPGVAPAAHGVLALPYEPGLDGRTLIAGLMASKRQVDQTLEQTRRLASADVPRTLGALRGTMASVDRLSAQTGQEIKPTLGRVRQTLGQVDHLAATVKRETAQSGPPLRRTLGQAGAAALAAQTTAREASAALHQVRTPLQRTVGELEQLSHGLNRLLAPLLGSGWLDPAGEAGAAGPRGENKPGVIPRGPGSSPGSELEDPGRAHPRMPLLP
jgi:phospholipid/cholesterol/gamma-HCH transport system substrate-binding protein